MEALGRVWEVDYEWLKGRFDEPQMMDAPGIPSTRWHDATLFPKDKVAQKDTLKAMFVMGHGGNTITRMPESAKAIEKLELLVVADPHPTTWASLSNRKDGTYLLPVATSYETNGSRVASNRSMQWGEQIVKPIFEIKDDLRSCISWRRSSASKTRCSRTSRSRTTCRWRKTSCAKSIAAGGRRATAANRRSASSRTWRTSRSST